MDGVEIVIHATLLFTSLLFFIAGIGIGKSLKSEEKIDEHMEAIRRIEKIMKWLEEERDKNKDE